MMQHVCFTFPKDFVSKINSLFFCYLAPPNDDYEQNDRAPDFEPMNNFEMNLNEYHEMIEDAEMESNASNNDSGTFLNYFFNTKFTKCLFYL